MKALDYDGTDHLIDKIYDLINSGGSADYIVEQGTSGIWTYEKWASGKAICWGRLSSASTTATYVNLNGYIPSGIMDTTTPKYINASGGFSGVPDSHIGYCRCSVAGRYDIYIYRSATLDRVADIDVIIKGLWKEFTPSVSKLSPLTEILYTGDWTATTSTSTSTNLTSTITVPKGYYILVYRVPACSATYAFALTINGTVNLKTVSTGGTYTECVYPIKLTQESNTIVVQPAASGTCNFSVIERGGLYAIKIANA